MCLTYLPFNRIFPIQNGKKFTISILLFSWIILFFSSSEINSNFLNNAEAQTCSNNLPINSVSAIGNDGNVPGNVLDNNLNTRWSNLGVGSWILADLGSTNTICSVDIAWYLGNQRTSNFVIATSTDGTTFTNVFSGTSSGITLNSEMYSFGSTSARYVRVTVNGNSQNNWASMTELDIFGTSSVQSGDYHYAPSLVLTGSNFQDVASSSSLQLSQFSVAAWFKTSSNFGSDVFIVNKGGTGSDSSGQNLNYGIWMTSSEQIKAGFETSSGADQYVTSVNTYNDGQWHYAVVTNSGSNVILYVDGLQVATKSTAGASPETSGTKPVRVGANSRVTPPGNFFTGEVDEVRAWNDDLTTQQVADAFAGNSFNTGEQVLYLSFASGSNSPPIANSQTVTVNKDIPMPITLTATDPDNDPLTCTIVNQPLHGTIPPTGPCGTARTYTPAAGYVGPDSFTFKANDGTVDSNTEAAVSINIIAPGQGGYNYAPSLVLTGSNFQDVASSSSLQLSQFSVAAWFKTSSNFGSDVFIVNKGGTGSDSSGQNLNYGIWMTSSEQIKAGFETSSGADQYVTSVNTYNDGQWHYAVVTNSGSNVILYVDGLQVATKSTAGASPETSGTKPVRVGANSRVTPPGNFFTGEVDEVRAWNDDLTTQQVADAFAGNSFNTGEQVLYLSFATSGAGTDIFGIKKLYSTKNNGEEWYMNMNNPLGDSRFNPQNTITKNADGSWKMKATQVRMAVYTSTGYHSDDITTLDHSEIASKGYMQAPNDWRNFEMTQYVKVNTSPSEDNFSPNGRGGRHTGDGTPPVGCEGSSMKGDVFFSGKVRFAKEQWHVSYVFTNLKTPTGSIEDKWVGIKFIVYNFVENNKVVVKTELWLDTNNNGNFVKVDETVDRGGWGTEGTECGGAPDQIISWGGPITTFRWDTATDVDFKNLSVREIVPPQ